MKSIKKPFLVALDSSTYGDISRDLYHEKSERKVEAQKIIQFFIDNAWIPVITWHHIEELLAHKNDTLVTKALLLIKQFPLVASLKTYNSIDHIGSIIDIESTEINEILCSHSQNLREIVEQTKNIIFKFSSGSDLITPYIDNVEVLKKYIRKKVNKKREIASISRAKSIQPENFKLSSVGDWELKPSSVALTKLNEMRISLENEIRNQGDKYLDDPNDTASKFMLSVFDSGKNMHDSNGSVKKKFLKEFGITPKEVEEFKYFHQIQYLAIFKKRLAVIARNLQIHQQKNIHHIREEYCPSWLLWKELHKIRTKAEKASGSDVDDGYLVALTYYADLTVVDKRTHEYLNQICRKNNVLNELIHPYVKLPKYSTIKNFGQSVSS